MTDHKRRTFIQSSLLAGAVFAGGSQARTSMPTPPETAGPFYPITPQKDQDFDLTQIDGHEQTALGDVVMIQGRVLDTEGQPIKSATVDIWQANAAGRYNHPHDPNTAPLDPNFQGWAIVPSGEAGQFRFKTIIPGAYPVSENWTRPPHIHFKVSKPGYHEVVTQMYFPNQPLNQVDRLLQSKTAEEQAMMLARVDGDESALLHYDVIMKPV